MITIKFDDLDQIVETIEKDLKEAKRSIDETRSEFSFALDTRLS
jgi:hypothetical protein